MRSACGSRAGRLGFPSRDWCFLTTTIEASCFVTNASTYSPRMFAPTIVTISLITDGRITQHTHTTHSRIGHVVGRYQLFVCLFVCLFVPLTSI
jgi:hypothetical protein